jgi:hypothetical protein
MTISQFHGIREMSDNTVICQEYINLPINLTLTILSLSESLWYCHAYKEDFIQLSINKWKKARVVFYLLFLPHSNMIKTPIKDDN